MASGRLLDTAELARILDDLPTSLKWDIVQLALDLIGIVNPAADAASGMISLVRGDLLGAAISAVSIFPIGDAAKLVKFRKYRISIEQLVGHARRNERLARALETPLKQIDDLLGSIRGFVGEQSPTILHEFMQNVDGIRRAIARYMQHLAKLKRIDRFGVERVARKLGSSGDQYVGLAGRRITVNDVVDLLAGAAGPGRSALVRRQASEMLEALAMSDGWIVTAGRHASDSDATQHITILVNGVEGQFHLRVDKRGHLFEITQGRAGSPL
jgi:hypothetical protein